MPYRRRLLFSTDRSALLTEAAIGVVERFFCLRVDMRVIW